MVQASCGHSAEHGLDMRQPLRFWLHLILGGVFPCHPMETLDPLLLGLFVLGVASTTTVFVVSFRRIDRNEKERAQVNRMRGRLHRLLKQRS